MQKNVNHGLNAVTITYIDQKIQLLAMQEKSVILGFFTFLTCRTQFFALFSGYEYKKMGSTQIDIPKSQKRGKSRIPTILNRENTKTQILIHKEEGMHAFLECL
ncbi:hypothetical protein AMTRI_Chr07g28470 [Amborella trichopoda]